MNNKLELLQLYLYLNKWQRNKLALLGKITVIKTFALLKIIYPLTVRENPPEHILTNITKRMYSFLLDNKPEKNRTKYNKKEYEEGGLKMIDIKAYISSIKASWVKRITNAENKGFCFKYG